MCQPGLALNEWGPAAWNTLHVVAHNYPLRPTRYDREATHKFLHLFARHLPCPACRKHFRALLAERIPSPTSHAFDGRGSLVAFMNDAHNDVNERLGKKTFTLEEHMEVYSLKPTIDPLRVTLLVCTVGGLCALAWARQQKQAV